MTNRFLSLALASILLIVLPAKSFAEKPKQRIIALAPHIVEMLFDIGAGDKIVGTVNYADFPKAALDIPRVGSYHGMQIPSRKRRLFFLKNKEIGCQIALEFH